MVVSIEPRQRRHLQAARPAPTGPEGNHNVLLTAKIRERDIVAIDRRRPEIGRRLFDQCRLLAVVFQGYFESSGAPRNQYAESSQDSDQQNCFDGKPRLRRHRGIVEGDGFHLFFCNSVASGDRVRTELLDSRTSYSVETASILYYLPFLDLCRRVKVKGRTYHSGEITARSDQASIFFSSLRKIFPDGVRGTASTKRISRGCL